MTNPLNRPGFGELNNSHNTKPMTTKLWKRLTTTALTTTLGTSVVLWGSSLNTSLALDFQDKADDLRKLLGVTTTATTESSEQLTALAPIVVSLSQIEGETPETAIATLHPHQWKYKLAVTLRVREIPVLTFIGTKADLAEIKNSEKNPEQIQANSDVMKRAEAVAESLNQLSQDQQFKPKNITVSANPQDKSYSIKVNDQELVRVNGQTILPDTTNNLAADALQATNRLRRLMGDAPPLTAIANMPSATPKAGKAGVKERVTGRRKGMASWYGPGFHGRLTANGERYNQNGLTAAHKSLPFGTRVRVTNLNNGRSITVRINDRGPYARGRIIDLSKGAARIIGLMNSGVAPVQIEILGR